MAFSSASAAFAGVLLICFGLGLAIITNGKPCSENSYKRWRYLYRDPQYTVTRNNMTYTYYHTGPQEEQYTIPLVHECNISVGLGAIIIVIGVFQFFLGIFAAILCCSVRRLTATSRTVVYLF